MLHRIKTVEARPQFHLQVEFLDGTVVIYDFSPLIVQNSPFWAFKLVHGLFEHALVDSGGYGVSWNDNVDIDAEELWTHGQRYATPNAE